MVDRGSLSRSRGNLPSKHCGPRKSAILIQPGRSSESLTKDDLRKRKDAECFEGLVEGGMMTGGVDSQDFGGGGRGTLFS